MGKFKASELELNDKLVYVGRTAKVVKGGRRFSFSAIPSRFCNMVVSFIRISFFI